MIIPPFLNWEIYFYESTCWAFINTLGTHAALIEVNISHIVFDGDSIKLADLLTFTASDASNATSLLGNSTLVVVYALNVNSTALRTLLAELDDMTWTSVGASTTTRTLLFINLRNASFRIDRDCAKLAGSHAIATTQTAEPAACFASAT